MKINSRFADGTRHMTTKGEIRILSHWYVGDIPYMKIHYLGTMETVDKKYTDVYKNVYYYERKNRTQEITTCMSPSAREVIEYKRPLKFGIELEINVPDKRDFIRRLERKGVPINTDCDTHTVVRDAWKVVHDGSLSSSWDRDCCEVVSPPSADFEQIKLVCEVMKEVGAKVNNSCGFHVHHDISEYKRKQIMRIYNFYAKYEHYIDKFHKADREDNSYCRPIEDIIDRVNNSETKSQLLRDVAGRGRGGYYNNIRYYKINLRSFIYYGTIEFRQHGGTIKFEDIYAWVNFTHKIIERALEIGHDIEPATSEQESEWRSNPKSAYDSMFDEIHIKNTEVSQHLMKRAKRRISELAA